MRNLARLLLMMMLASTLGCAQKDWIDRTLVTENVTGSWSGAIVGSMGGASGSIWLTLMQEGGRVRGEFHASGYLASWMTTDGALEGTVAGDVFTFNDTHRTVTGELTVSADEMHGRVGRYQGVVLHRVEPSSAPTPPR